MRKYPKSLFLVGVISNVLFRFFYLSIPAFICLIIGILNTKALYLGLAVLCLDIVVSFISQLKICRTFSQESDSKDFNEFRDALSADENWVENVKSFVEAKISEEDSSEE